MSAGTEPTDQQPPAIPDASAGEMEARQSWRNILWLAGGVAVLLAIVYLTPLRHYLGHLREVSQYVRSLGVLGPLLFTLAVAFLAPVGAPRWAICWIAGMAFGFWLGLLCAQVGTLMGSYATFLVTRWGGRVWAQHYLSKRGRLQALVRREGVAGVILARQVPLPGVFINLACGLFSVRHRDFILGTVVGQLPQAVPCVLIGAGTLQASYRQSLGAITLAVVAAAVGWLALRWLIRRRSPITT